LVAFFLSLLHIAMLFFCFWNKWLNGIELNIQFTFVTTASHLLYAKIPNVNAVRSHVDKITSRLYYTHVKLLTTECAGNFRQVVILPYVCYLFIKWCIHRTYIVIYYSTKVYRLHERVIKIMYLYSCTTTPDIIRLRLVSKNGSQN